MAGRDSSSFTISKMSSSPQNPPATEMTGSDDDSGEFLRILFFFCFILHYLLPCPKNMGQYIGQYCIYGILQKSLSFHSDEAKSIYVYECLSIVYTKARTTNYRPHRGTYNDDRKKLTWVAHRKNQNGRHMYYIADNTARFFSLFLLFLEVMLAATTQLNPSSLFFCSVHIYSLLLFIYLAR